MDPKILRKEHLHPARHPGPEGEGPGRKAWRRSGTASPPSSPSAAFVTWGSPAASASWAPAASTRSATAPSGACAAPTPTSWWPGTWPAWWPPGPRPTPTTAGTWWRPCWPWAKARPRATSSPISAKLDRLAAEFGVAADLPPQAKAKELALAMMEEYGIKKGYLTFTQRLPAARLEKWQKLGIAPRGIDWEVAGDDAPHPHGGGQRSGQSAAPGPAGAPWRRLGRLHDRHRDLRRPVRHPQAHRLPGQPGGAEGRPGEYHPPRPLPPGLGDGGPGRPGPGAADPGPGIGGPGHQPGGPVLHRQRSADAPRASPWPATTWSRNWPSSPARWRPWWWTTSASCPPWADMATCYHTQFFTTYAQGQVPRGHPPVTSLRKTAPELGRDTGVRRRWKISPGATRTGSSSRSSPVAQVSGFSVEVIQEALGGTWEPLLDAIKAGQIRGAVGVVGCNNPKITQDYGHVNLTRDAHRRGHPGPGHRLRRGGPRQGGLQGAGGRGAGRARASRPSARPWAFPRCCIWAPAWTTPASSIWPPFWPAPWGWTWTCCRWPRPPRSGTRRRPPPSPATPWPAASSRSWGWRPPVLGSTTVTDLLLNGLEAHLGAKFAVEPDPDQGRGPDHQPYRGQTPGPGAGRPVNLLALPKSRRAASRPPDDLFPVTPCQEK